jgi:arsenite methyltransferase
MVISDLVTDREVTLTDADAEMWNSCIDGALTKEHYIDSVRHAGFQNIEVLNEWIYMNPKEDSNNRDNGRKGRSLPA